MAQSASRSFPCIAPVTRICIGGARLAEAVHSPFLSIPGTLVTCLVAPRLKPPRRAVVR